MYCDEADLLRGQPKLADTDIAISLVAIITEATEFVRDDLMAIADMSSIDIDVEAGMIPPVSVYRLAVIKARELAYRVYYGGKVPAESEIQYFAEQYRVRLDQLRADVEAGRLTSGLTPAGETDTELWSMFA